MISYVLALFSKKIMFPWKKKRTLHKKLLQLRKKQMVVETQKICLDQFSSIKNGKDLTRMYETKETKTFCKSVDIDSVKNNIGEIVSSIIMWNVVPFLVVKFFLWVGSKQLERKGNFSRLNEQKSPCPNLWWT